MTALGGGAAAAEALIEAQAAIEKERRVELLRRQIARRMLNQGIIRGWTAWAELWYAKKNAFAILRRATNRFRTPALADAFAFWVADWDSEKRAAASAARISELRQTANGARGAQSSLEQELETVRAEMRAKLADADTEKRAALERLRVELVGSAEEMAALREQQAKEDRVELLRRQIMRRMMNQGISRGWTAWVEMWSAKTYAMARLREVGNRFRTPELAGAFTHWADVHIQIKQATHIAGLERQSKSLEGQLRQVRFEAGQLSMIKVAQADELKSLKEKLSQLDSEAKDREARLSEAAGYRKENEELRELHRASVEAASTELKKREEAEADAAQQRQADKDLLEKLLAEQRTSFEEEQSQSRVQLSKVYEERRTHEEEVVQMNGEMARLRSEAAKAQQELTDQISKLKQEIAKLKKPPPPKKVERKKGPLGDIDLDESPNAPPISEQLAAALRKNSTRVLDLFRNWDADGDGEVSRAEFHKAMPALGLEVPKDAIDKLFTEWDKSGDGSLGLRELTKILRAPTNLTTPSVSSAATSAAAAMNMMKFAGKAKGASS